MQLYQLVESMHQYTWLESKYAITVYPVTNCRLGLGIIYKFYSGID